MWQPRGSELAIKILFLVGGAECVEESFFIGIYGCLTWNEDEFRLFCECSRSWSLVWSSGALETSFRSGDLEWWLVAGWQFYGGVVVCFDLLWGEVVRGRFLFWVAAWSWFFLDCSSSAIKDSLACSRFFLILIVQVWTYLGLCWVKSVKIWFLGFTLVRVKRVKVWCEILLFVL